MIVNERGDRVNVHDVQVEYGSVHQILDLIIETFPPHNTLPFEGQHVPENNFQERNRPAEIMRTQTRHRRKDGQEGKVSSSDSHKVPPVAG